MATPSLGCLLLTTLWIFSFIVPDVSAGTNCGYYNSYGYYRYRYCSRGCCGSTYAYVCCSVSPTIVLSASAITGIVIGACFCVACIAAFLILLKKKRYWRGRSIVGNRNNIVVSSSTTASKPVSTVQVAPHVPHNPYPAYPPPPYPPPPQQPHPSNNPPYPQPHPSNNPPYPQPQQPHPSNDPAYPPPPPVYSTMSTTTHVY
ncbi:cysteine and tyrosine-rich protein 1-like [Haliotis rufescens]|uniref:cysteine and tyrosine-rich protein 1-like n=1 Tax=Haliotis rufescens TaxID=6454 RepID=UPI00201F6E86|nr:cysteine and tyrosine-rich protein 1-like [Haliotis rufescens]